VEASLSLCSNKGMRFSLHERALEKCIVQMPEMDGFETTAAIRARERGNGTHLPIIAMTAHAMQGDRERCIAAGMDSYISKPLDVWELIELVEKFADGARQEANRA
jgi:two-component system, sensor histidine kinase and response regulator